MNKAYFEQVSPFLSYLQKRMDFIAQVATSAPSWCLLTDFDALIGGFTEQFCLTKNIIRSHQGTRGGPDFSPLLEKDYVGEPKKAPLLDLPHGEIGAQAFYTILENVIRNTAKYGDPVQLSRIKHRTGDGNLRFTIAVHETWNDGGRDWAKDYYKVQIIDQLENKTANGLPNQEVVDKLNGFLSEYLTDPVTGVVKPKNWGMKEIKICAAYLRMVKQDQIDLAFEEWRKDGAAAGDGAATRNGNTVQPPIIDVSLEKLSREKKLDVPALHLTYNLYLLRPKQALVVSYDKPNEDAQKLGGPEGIDYYALKPFLRLIEQGVRPRHTFIVLPKPRNIEEWEWLEHNLNFLPARVLIRNCTEAEVPTSFPCKPTQLSNTPAFQPARLSTEAEVPASLSEPTQLPNTLAFLPAQIPVGPALLIDTLWNNWVNRWWGNYRILVRDRRHNNTIAELGKDEAWDDADTLPEGDWVVFDHKETQDKTRLFDRAAYHHGFWHGSAISRMLAKDGRDLLRDSSKRTNEQVENYSRLRIKEMAGLTVAVIDERVWLEKDGPALEGVKYYVSNTSRMQVWRKRRVFLLDANHALDDFFGFVDKFHQLYPKEFGIFDFIIIHQGIIDTAREKADQFERAWKRLKNRARWMVIDSGRGQPEQAGKEDLRWVEYSNLAECLVRYAGDKFRLAELLWTLRGSSRN